MKKLIIIYLSLFSLALTGCELPKDVSPDALQKQEIQGKIDEITKKLEELQKDSSSDVGSKKTENSKDEKHDGKNDTDSKNPRNSKKDEIEKLLKQLEALKNALNSGSRSGSSTAGSAGASSTSNAAAGCSLDGVTLASGQSHVFFKTSTVPAGEACLQVERKCNNGVMEGNIDYKFKTCHVAVMPVIPGGAPFVPNVPDGPAGGVVNLPDLDPIVPDFINNCELDGVTILNGSGQNFYEYDQINGDCEPYKQFRTCTNGVLDGESKYKHKLCIDVSGLIDPFGGMEESFSCTLDGITMSNNENRVFYSQSNIPVGESCDDYSLVRTCKFGSLSGSDSYNKAECLPNIIEPIIPSGGEFIPEPVLPGGNGGEFNPSELPTMPGNPTIPMAPVIPSNPMVDPIVPLNPVVPLNPTF
jgi:hypothetical protein